MTKCAKLWFLIFLDNFVIALLMPIWTTHIISIGGSHTIVGFLFASRVCLQRLSIPFSRSFTEVFGNKVTLLGSLTIGTVINLFLSIATCYQVILLKLIFYVTNVTQLLCKNIIVEQEPVNMHSYYFKVIDIFGTLGLVLGPLIGGYIFEFDKGFIYICVVSAFLSFFSLCLVLFLPYEKGNGIFNYASMKKNLLESFQFILLVYKKVNWLSQWNVLTLESLIMMSITSFFSKISLLLRLQFKASPFIIGFTFAYQNILTFSLGPLLETYLHLHGTSIQRFQIHLICIIIFISIALFVQVYDYYMLAIIIPMLTMQSCLKNVLMVLYDETDTLPDTSDLVAAASSVFSSITLGIFCDLYAQQAVKAFTITPLVLALFLSMFYKKATIKQD